MNSDARQSPDRPSASHTIVAATGKTTARPRMVVDEPTTSTSLVTTRFSVFQMSSSAASVVPANSVVASCTAPGRPGCTSASRNAALRAPDAQLRRAHEG